VLRQNSAAAKVCEFQSCRPRLCHAGSAFVLVVVRIVGGGDVIDDRDLLVGDQRFVRGGFLQIGQRGCTVCLGLALWVWRSPGDQVVPMLTDLAIFHAKQIEGDHRGRGRGCAEGDRRRNTRLRWPF
jgi:hypothetical protein